MFSFTRVIQNVSLFSKIAIAAVAALMLSPAVAGPPDAPYMRIEIRYPGVYNISAKELSEAGLDISKISPDKIGLRSAGEVVPIYVAGASDGKFDLQDYVEFVGSSARGSSTWYLPDNKRNVYYLTWNEANPLQFEKVNAATSESTAPVQHFWQWKHIESNFQFWFSTLPPDQTDNFFWYPIFADTKPEEALQVNLHFPGYDKSLGIPVEVSLHVFGSTEAAGVKPSHQFKILYDQKPISEFSFDGIRFFDASFEIPSTTVKLEPTRYNVTAPEERRPVVDRIFIDWVRTKYPSKYDAEGLEYYVFNNDLFSTATNTTQSLYISNLPAGASIFDPGTNRIWQLEDNQGSAKIENSNVLTTYTAVMPSARMRADVLELADEVIKPEDMPAGLQTLVIYHPKLQPTAEAYTSYRRARGMKVKAVSVHSIFDQTNNGYISDAALKSYIEQTKDHYASLSSIVLIGDSYFDFREARSYDDEKQLEVLIPIHWVYRPGVTWSGGYQDDNWYGSFQNEYRPDIAVGRIAVNSNQEGMEYLRKVIEYEAFRKTANDKGLLISSVEKSFQQYVTEIGTKYQDRVSTMSYLFPEAETASQEVVSLLNAFNEGAQFVYYVGHGGAMVWRVGPVDFARQKDLFTPKDVAKLKNHGHYPLIVCASCYTTSFDQSESIGEALVNQPEGGAIAVIGAPWKATVQESHDFNRLLFKHYFDPTVKTLGEASLLAHREHVPENQSHALFNSFTLLGDPCLEIVR